MRILSICVVFAAFVALSAAEHGSGTKNRRESALDKIVPRLLWNLRRGDNNQESHRQQPQVIIVQQPSSNSDDDRHHHHQQHHPHYPYYPYYPPPPQTRPPQPQFPGMEYLGTGSGGPTFLIVNPNNMQGIYLPSSANSSNTTSARRSAFAPSFADLLQGLNLNDLADGSLFEDDTEVVEAAEEAGPEAAAVENERPAVSAAAQEEDHDGDLLSEDEIDALDRQNNRGLSPKLLFSMLMQDKRRRRIQEVLAGIYLRNTHLNRK